MPDQRKSLTAQQREALLLARRIIDQQPHSTLTLGMVIRDILAAFADELGDDEEPVPAAVIQAAKDAHPLPDRRPGGCTCGGHAEVTSPHDVTWVPAARIPLDVV